MTEPQVKGQPKTGLTDGEKFGEKSCPKGGGEFGERGGVFVVTGGGSGIGRAVVAQLPASNTVVITGRHLSKLQTVADQLNAQGHHVVPHVCDVSSRDQVRELARFAASLGPIRRVVHAAGISGSMGDPQKIIRINALGTVYVNQEFYQVMHGGCILDVASNSGYMLPGILVPQRSYPLALTDEDAFVRVLARRAGVFHRKDVDPQMAYMISKNFARWYSANCAFKYMRTRFIRVLSVSPGFVQTPMTEAEKGKATDILLGYSGPGRGATPDELAFLICSLSDPRCGYLMGTDVLCDAGCVSAGYRMTVATDPKKVPTPGGAW
ncbi:MAG: SDR family NAD(P)-dependent oxidoreductase [Atopobiaceae bacterium]